MNARATDWQMAMIHLQTAVTLLSPVTSPMNVVECRRFVVDRAIQTCERAKCRVLVSDIVDITRLPHEQVLDALNRSSKVKVIKAPKNGQNRLYVTLIGDAS